MTFDARAPGWYSDPTGRHALRWWNGAAWTERVAEATEDDALGATPAAGILALTEDAPRSVPTPTVTPEPQREPTTPPATRDRGPAVGNALGRVALALLAAGIMVGASFLSWLDIDLPRGSSGEMTGWELADIPKIADVESSDPRPIEGPSFENIEALAQALNANGFLCPLIGDPAAIPADAPFTARGACGPFPGALPGTPPEGVFASAAPKFTISATSQQNQQIVESYLNAVARADEGPGIRGYGLILYGPNWAMSSSDETSLLKAKTAIGGTLMSTDVEHNQFYVPDLFSFGFFTGLTTVILGGATAVLAAVFMLAVIVARRSARPAPGWRAVGAPFVVAGLTGTVGLNWISWFTRGDGYDGVGLQIGFFLVTLGALLAVWALASFVIFPSEGDAHQP
jgi:Protein of unknown function (DUF2510)